LIFLRLTAILHASPGDIIIYSASLPRLFGDIKRASH
jgi:hypothetical protein